MSNKQRKKWKVKPIVGVGAAILICGLFLVSVYWLTTSRGPVFVETQQSQAPSAPEIAINKEDSIGILRSLPVTPLPGAQKDTGASSTAAAVLSPARSNGSPAHPWLKSAQAYLDPGAGPMIAIVLDDVGVAKENAERALSLPSFITLALMTYADHVDELAQRARALGHELLVHFPMEPIDPRYDPGPNALHVGLEDQEIKRRLDWGLSRFEGYIGLNNHMGSRATQDEGLMREVLRELKSRGLIFLDSRTVPRSLGNRLSLEIGVDHLARDIFLDDDLDPGAIMAQLTKAEMVAARKGYAIAIGHPHPQTIQALEQWIAGAKERGFHLVPISYILCRQIDCSS